MKEFELDTFIGQKVYEINIGIRADGSKCQCTSYHRDGIFIEEHQIVFQSPYKIALNDDYITILDRQELGKKGESYNYFLEKCSVSIITKENYFPNGIFGKLLTIGNVEKGIAKLKRKIISETNAQYGFLKMNIEGILADYKYEKL